MRRALIVVAALAAAGASTATATEPVRVGWCAAARACGAHPLGRDGDAAWAALRDGAIGRDTTILFWSRADYDRFADARPTLAAELRERARAVDAAVDGWRWLGEEQRALVWAAAAASPAALDRALAALVRLAPENDVQRLAASERRAIAELRALVPRGGDAAAEARAQAERFAVELRGLPAPATPPADERVAHVYWVPGMAAPARLPNGERGPLPLDGGAVAALATPPAGATLVELDPQRFADERDRLAPARLAAELRRRLAAGAPASDALDYVDDRVLTVATVRAAVAAQAPPTLAAALRAQKDADVAALVRVARRHVSGDSAAALTTNARTLAATAALMARLVRAAGRDELARTLDAVRAFDDALAR